MLPSPATSGVGWCGTVGGIELGAGWCLGRGCVPVQPHSTPPTLGQWVFRVSRLNRLELGSSQGHFLAGVYVHLFHSARRLPLGAGDGRGPTSMFNEWGVVGRPGLCGGRFRRPFHARISACDPKSARFCSRWRRTHRSVRLKAPNGWGRYQGSPVSECGVATTAEFSLNNVLPQPPADGA